VSNHAWVFVYVAALAGQALVAGPWIGALSAHYHQWTFATAASSNHANVSPANLGRDPLWKPGLVADFIADPRLTPNWSPFQDGTHFVHQLRVCLSNANIAAGHMVLWLALLGAAAGCWITRRRSAVPGPRRVGQGGAAVWSLLVASLYVAGYCSINAEARYVVPVAAPLLCLAALLLLSLATPTANPGRGRMLIAFLFLLPFTLQDVFRAQRIAFQHPQTAHLADASAIAQRLAEVRVPAGLMAANRYHSGLYVAFAANRVAEYLGAPTVEDPATLAQQLAASGATIYLRWVSSRQGEANVAPLDAFVPSPPWTLAGEVRGSDLSPSRVEIYVLLDPPVPAGFAPARSLWLMPATASVHDEVGKGTVVLR